jgi:NAD(P)-dependent dehydrogenase (short-subunit alcohol dehydrogenase family)
MLRGKIIIVTGAGSGVGRSSAKMFAAAGAKVIVSDIDSISGEETVRRISAEKHNAKFVNANVAIESEVKAMVEFAVRTYGRLDGALNNASIEMPNKPIHKLTAEDWHVSLMSISPA